ncbi:unnamed protein product [Victoria cruziana]
MREVNRSRFILTPHWLRSDSRSFFTGGARLPFDLFSLSSEVVGSEWSSGFCEESYRGNAFLCSGSGLFPLLRVWER